MGHPWNGKDLCTNINHSTDYPQLNDPGVTPPTLWLDGHEEAHRKGVNAMYPYTRGFTPDNYDYTNFDFGGNTPVVIYGVNLPERPTTQVVSIMGKASDGPGNFVTLVLGWEKGNGEATALFMAETTFGHPRPIDLEQYQADSYFGRGSQVGASGWYCVYNGTGAGTIVYSLKKNAVYRVMATTYNGSTVSAPIYSNDIVSGNPSNLSTDLSVPVPSIPPGAVIPLGLLLLGFGSWRLVQGGRDTPVGRK